MRRPLALLLLCALDGAAFGDGDTTWDGTYTTDNDGPSYQCPHPTSVVVSHGAYSFAWTITTGNDASVRIGTITGSVRASGLATTKATLLDPMPADAQATMENLGEPLDKFRTAANGIKIEFNKTAVDRSFHLSVGTCYASWINDGPPPAAPAATVTGTPKVDHERGATKKLKPPAPLQAGAPKWDTMYVPRSRSSADWRCPGHELTKLVVSKGRFTMPYTVSARSGRGVAYGDMTLGQLDGSIAANGEVTLRPWFSVSELPPEITDGRKPSEASLDYLRAFASTLTMTFTANGDARYAKLVVGDGTSCEISLESKGSSKPGPAKPATNGDPVIYGRGVKWSKARMNAVDDFESNKDSWDHGSVRKDRGNMSYGQITTAYRCDARDGCKDTGHGWTAIGYYLEPW